MEGFEGGACRIGQRAHARARNERIVPQRDIAVPPSRGIEPVGIGEGVEDLAFVGKALPADVDILAVGEEGLHLVIVQHLVKHHQLADRAEIGTRDGLPRIGLMGVAEHDRLAFIRNDQIVDIRVFQRLLLAVDPDPETLVCGGSFIRIGQMVPLFDRGLDLREEGVAPEETGRAGFGRAVVERAVLLVAPFAETPGEDGRLVAVAAGGVDPHGAGPAVVAGEARRDGRAVHRLGVLAAEEDALDHALLGIVRYVGDGHARTREGPDLKEEILVGLVFHDLSGQTHHDIGTGEGGKVSVDLLKIVGLSILPDPPPRGALRREGQRSQVGVGGHEEEITLRGLKHPRVRKGDGGVFAALDQEGSDHGQRVSFGIRGNDEGAVQRQRSVQLHAIQPDRRPFRHGDGGGEEGLMQLQGTLVHHGRAGVGRRHPQIARTCLPESAVTREGEHREDVHIIFLTDDIHGRYGLRFKVDVHAPAEDDVHLVVFRDPDRAAGEGEADVAGCREDDAARLQHAAGEGEVGGRIGCVADVKQIRDIGHAGVLPVVDDTGGVAAEVEVAGATEHRVVARLVIVRLSVGTLREVHPRPVVADAVDDAVDVGDDRIGVGAGGETDAPDICAAVPGDGDDGIDHDDAAGGVDRGEINPVHAIAILSQDRGVIHVDGDVITLCVTEHSDFFGVEGAPRQIQGGFSIYGDAVDRQIASRKVQSGVVENRVGGVVAAA